jgi:hypothetical protein
MPEDFAQLRYADPTAPKGGRFVQGVLATSTHLSYRCPLARYPRHSGARPGGFLLGPRRGSQPPRLNLQESSRDESVERSSEGVPYARS